MTIFLILVDRYTMACLVFHMRMAIAILAPKATRLQPIIYLKQNRI
jgi:hypothetical protein